MTLPIPTISISNASLKGGQNTIWKLGQVTEGRVAGVSRTNSTVNIGGSSYKVTSPLQFSQGESLLLKVSGVSPQIEFSIIARSRRDVGNSDAASVILSDKFLRSAAITDRSINASLSSLVGLLHTSSTSPLKPATALLIESLRSRLIRAGGLSNPKLLRRSLLTGSVLVGRSSQSMSPGGELLNLLGQIAESMDSQSNRTQQLAAGVKYQQALGMSLYLSDEINILRKLSREVDGHYTNLLNLRNKTLDDPQQHPYRLLAELPVLFRDHVKSISIRFLEKKAGSKKKPEATSYSVEFEFEFDDGEIYARILIAGSTVSFQIACVEHRTALSLKAGKVGLAGKLEAYGLKLGELTVGVGDRYLPRDRGLTGVESQRELEDIAALPSSTDSSDETVRTWLRENHAQGRIPDLEEFAVRIGDRDIEPIKQIPVELYCSMACFFAQLFESGKNEVTTS